MPSLQTLSAKTKRRVRLRILHFLLLPTDVRKWRQRCVTKYEAIDEDRIRDKTSFQFYISSRAVSRCLKGITGVDENEDASLKELRDNPEELVGQEFELIVPFCIYPKRILLDFSIEGTSGGDVLLSRYESSRLSLSLSLPMYFRSDRSHRLFFRSNQKMLRAILFQAPEDLKMHLVSNGVGLDGSQYFDEQNLPRAEKLQLLAEEKERIKKCIIQWLIPFLAEPDTRTYSAQLDGIIEYGMILQRLGLGHFNHTGQYDPVLNPVNLILDYFKLAMKRSDAGGLMILKEFVGAAERYAQQLISLFEQGITTRQVIYEILRHFSDNYIAYAPCKIKIGMPFVIKTQHVMPLVSEKRGSKDRLNYYLRRYLKFGNTSKYRSIAYPIEIGDDLSRHYEIVCPSQTEIHIVPEESFIEIGNKRIQPGRIFGYSSHDSIERQHFYTTKTYAEKSRILGAMGVDPQLEMRIWIRYELEDSIRRAYFWSLVFLIATSVVFLFKYDPAQNPSPLTIIPVINPLIALFLNLRPKERITAKRLENYKRLLAAISVFLVVYFVVRGLDLFSYVKNVLY